MSFRIRLTAALTAALAAFGGFAGGTEFAHDRVISAPDCVDASSIVAELAPAPHNSTYLRVQHIGDPGTAELASEVANVITWDVSAFSGLSVPPSAYAQAQRGYRDAGPPQAASAFQLWCNGAGFFMDSRRFSHTSPLVLEGPSVSMARDLDPPAPIFGNATSALTIQARVAVPLVRSDAPPVIDGTAQAGFFYYAQDMTTGATFAHVIAVFDNRTQGTNGAGGEAVSADAYTPFVVSPLSGSAAFVTPSADSAVEQFVSGWAEPRFFRAHVTYAQFASMLARLKRESLPGISPRPEDYRVTLFGVLGEIFPGTGTANEVALGASALDLALSEAFDDVAPVQALEFYNAARDHYFVSARADDIEALDSGRFAGWARTGESFAVYPAFVAGTSSVCRYYLPPAFGDSHFFSASPSECADVAAKFPGFVLEDAQVMYAALPDALTGACPAGSDSVYRLWNARPATNHRYTTSASTRQAMIDRGWVSEGYGPHGVAMCAAPPL